MSNNIYFLISVGPLIHELPFLAPTFKKFVKLNALCIVFLCLARSFGKSVHSKYSMATHHAPPLNFKFKRYFQQQIFIERTIFTALKVILLQNVMYIIEQKMFQILLSLIFYPLSTRLLMI